MWRGVLGRDAQFDGEPGDVLVLGGADVAAQVVRVAVDVDGLALATDPGCRLQDDRPVSGAFQFPREAPRTRLEQHDRPTRQPVQVCPFVQLRQLQPVAPGHIEQVSPPVKLFQGLDSPGLGGRLFSAGARQGDLQVR